MEQNQELALTQMKKSLQKLGFSTQKWSDETLMRFLIARSMEWEKAAKMLVQWHKWRTSFVPNGSISDSEVKDELQQKKVYLQGLSGGVFPVVLVKACKHYQSKDQLQFKKFVVYFLDKTIASSFKGRETGNEKLIAILDLKNISYSNVDARGLITGFQFLQAYYPERLVKVYILDMPRFFVSVWRIVSRFLEKATQEKVVIVSNEEEREAFVREVTKEVLPEEYGGKAILVAIQDVVLPRCSD